MPQCGDEGLLDRLFGDVDVTEAADQGGNGPPRLLTEDLFDLPTVDCSRAAQAGSSWKGRTSTGP